MDRIPILKMGELLLISVQVDMHDKLAVALQDDLTARIADTHAKGVLIDISTLETVDSYVARMLDNTGRMAKLMGTETVIVGMRPAVAATLIRMGYLMTGIRTALSLQEGLALYAKRTQDMDEEEV